ncbi:glucose 1-dehydrogenase [Sphingosinicella xenopeptidilytica]|uniref:Glucose 1-dehydrogenase n=1 Tax=Sphingosinicella xenopeptidilytica TaxID=364098 RepID=A0ABW3C5Q4_SPHXN
MGLVEGKSGIVTGAAGGIGRATAILFAKEGASVIVSDLEACRAAAEETVALANAAGGGKAVFVAADVAKAADAEMLVNECVSRFGRLDYAFNNAGILAVGFTSQVEEDEFDRIMEVDVKGVWLCMKYQLRQMMKNGGGVIINTSSEGGLVGTPLAGPYVAAKHAVIGLTKTAAGEYANMNIRVNSVAPGTIATPMVLSLPKEAQEMLMAPQPLHRLGNPEEVAEGVVWLASDRASFITGITLSIDGGATSNAQSYDPKLSPEKLD